jgi:hypothetical protein
MYTIHEDARILIDDLSIFVFKIFTPCFYVNSFLKLRMVSDMHSLSAT